LAFPVARNARSWNHGSFKFPGASSCGLEKCTAGNKKIKKRKMSTLVSNAKTDWRRQLASNQSTQPALKWDSSASDRPVRDAIPGAGERTVCGLADIKQAEPCRADHCDLLHPSRKSFSYFTPWIDTQ
jgi:hypothetical protein